MTSNERASKLIYKLVQSCKEWPLLIFKSSTQQAKEDAFISRLHDLFVVAHANSMSIITIQEDKDFLLEQQEKESEDQWLD